MIYTACIRNTQKKRGLIIFFDVVGDIYFSHTSLCVHVIPHDDIMMYIVQVLSFAGHCALRVCCVVLHMHIWQAQSSCRFFGMFLFRRSLAVLRQILQLACLPTRMSLDGTYLGVCVCVCVLCVSEGTFHPPAIIIVVVFLHICTSCVQATHRLPAAYSSFTASR